MEEARRRLGRLSLIEAMLVSVFVLGLFYYWYGLADRYVIFLYGHVAGGIKTTPAQAFDATTSSRYWMAGLVAAGAVMALSVAAGGVLGRLAVWRKRNSVPPRWPQVWALAALPIGVGVPAITMTVNAPTLPPGLAAACVAATLLGLAIALAAGEWAATRPAELAWLAADSVGLMPALLLLRTVELPGRGMSVSRPAAWLAAIGGLTAGLIWLAGMSALRRWRRSATPSAVSLFVGGLGLSYVLMPLVHYLLATPAAYRYISTASNFFAFDGRIQLLALGVAAGLAVGTTRMRRRLWGR